MGDDVQKKAVILDGEESFARAVALGVIVKREPSVWHFLLPGMFLFDFLRRSSEMKRYSDLFLFPRKLALDAAFDLLRGEDRNQVFLRLEEGIKGWLMPLKLDSERLLHAHKSELALLVDHYVKLLQSGEGNYYGLIQQAYSTRGEYEAFLAQLSAAESEVDQALADFHGRSDAIWQRIEAENVQVETLRKKEVQRIFS